MTRLSNAGHEIQEALNNSKNTLCSASSFEVLSSVGLAYSDATNQILVENVIQAQAALVKEIKRRKQRMFDDAKAAIEEGEISDAESILLSLQFHLEDHPLVTELSDLIEQFYHGRPFSEQLNRYRLYQDAPGVSSSTYTALWEVYDTLKRGQPFVATALLDGIKDDTIHFGEGLRRLIRFALDTHDLISSVKSALLNTDYEKAIQNLHEAEKRGGLDQYLIEAKTHAIEHLLQLAQSAPASVKETPMQLVELALRIDPKNEVVLYFQAYLQKQPPVPAISDVLDDPNQRWSLWEKATQISILNGSTYRECLIQAQQYLSTWTISKAAHCYKQSQLRTIEPEVQARAEILKLAIDLGSDILTRIIDAPMWSATKNYTNLVQLIHDAITLHPTHPFLDFLRPMISDSHVDGLMVDAGAARLNGDEEEARQIAQSVLEIRPNHEGAMAILYPQDTPTEASA